MCSTRPMVSWACQAETYESGKVHDLLRLVLRRCDGRWKTSRRWLASVAFFVEQGGSDRPAASATKAEVRGRTREPRWSSFPAPADQPSRKPPIDRLVPTLIHPGINKTFSIIAISHSWSGGCQKGKKYAATVFFSCPRYRFDVH